MLLLGLRTLRTRAGSFAGAFVMIAVTVTIVAAAGQLMATALGAPGAGRFAAVDAVVRADPDVTFGHGEDAETVEVARSALLPPAAVARAAAVPGVRAAVGDVAFPLTVIGRDGRPLPTRGATPAQAHGWPSAALTPYRLTAGRPPAGAGEIVLDSALARAGDLRVGDRVRVVAPGGAETLRVSGIAQAARDQQERQSAAFLTQAAAQRISGLGDGFDAIAIRAEPGAGPALRERLREAVAATAGVSGTPQVLDRRHAATADAGDPRAFERVTLVAVVASGGGLTTAIAVFVVAGTIAFVVGRRRREIALLRAVGATPGQVRWLLLWETALVGLLAGVAGCLAASALMGTFTAALISVDLAPDGFAVAPHWLPWAVAVATGVVVALLAALLAVRRALTVLPGEALVASALPPRRLGVVRALLGAIALGGGLTLVVTLSSAALSFASLAAFLFAIGIALLAPLLLGWPAALGGRLLRGAGGSGFLAGAALATGRFRVGAVGAAIALIVALAGAQVVALATARDAAQRDSAARVRAERVLVARDGGGLPPSVAAEAARLPGVRAAAGMVSTELFLLDDGLTNDGDSWSAVGLDPAATRGTLALGVSAGSLDAVDGDGIAVSDAVAEAGDVRIGQQVDARLADGTSARLRVVAIYRRQNGMGDVVLPRSLALPHAAAALDAAVFVAADDDAVATRALAGLRRAVPTVSVRSRADYLDGVDAGQQENADAQWVIAALMLVVAAMAAFNTGAMAAAERRPELALARLAGATRRQVVLAQALEALVTTLVGLAAGAAAALASLTLAGEDPTGGPLAIPLGSSALVLATGAALGLLGTLLPALLVGRSGPIARAGERA